MLERSTDPIRKPGWCQQPRTSPSTGEQLGGLGDALLGVDEGVLVLDGDSLDAAMRLQLAEKSRPPGGLMAATHDGAVPGHGVGAERPAAGEEAGQAKVGRGT